MTTAALSNVDRGRSALTFLRHLGEMTLSMFVGMFAFGLALGVIAGLAGSNPESWRVSQPELFMLGMGSAMSVTMLAWMHRRRHGNQGGNARFRRGHDRRQSWEMTAAMFVPVLGVLVCYWMGAITADSVCPLSCALMIPAMAAAMLFRLGLYTSPDAAGQESPSWASWRPSSGSRARS